MLKLCLERKQSQIDMKRLKQNYVQQLIAILISCICLQSCNQMEVETIDPPIIHTKTRAELYESYHKDNDVTREMVEAFVTSNKGNRSVVSIEPYEIDGIIAFYIVSFERGFKVISADTRTVPILAESDEEGLDVERAHTGQKAWLEDTADIIRNIKEGKIDTKEDYSSFWDFYSQEMNESIPTRSIPPGLDSIWIKTIETSSSPSTVYAHVPHLLNTKWGQNYPWNEKMPTINGNHCLAGCVPVAIGQVLYYYSIKDNTPRDLWHSIEITNFDNDSHTVYLSKSQYTANSIRWMAMATHSYFNYTNYVSDLLLDLGERLPVHYFLDISYVILGAYDSSIPNINQCGISSSYSAYGFNTVKTDLMNDNPVIAVATSAVGTVGSHIWVIDGCDDYIQKNVQTATFNYISIDELPEDPAPVAMYSNDDMLRLYPNAVNGMQIETVSYTPYQRLLMNWGFDGNGDDVSYGVLGSSDWNYLNENFYYNRHIYYNISTNQLN